MAIGIGISPVFGNRNIVFAPELITYMTGLVTPLSDGEKIILNTLINTIKTGFGITDLDDAIDAIWILGEETEECSLKNLVKDATHATKISTPAWVQFEGFTANPTGSRFLNSNFTPSIHGINYTLNSASYGVYIRTNYQENKADFGSATNLTQNWTTLATRNTSNNATCWINQAYAGAPTVANTDSRGMYIVNRTGANDCDLYKNKVRIINGSNAAQGLSTISLRIGGLLAGVYQEVCSKQIAIAFVATGLTQARIDCLTDAFETLMDAHGKGVLT